MWHSIWATSHGGESTKGKVSNLLRRPLWKLLYKKIPGRWYQNHRGWVMEDFLVYIMLITICLYSREISFSLKQSSFLQRGNPWQVSHFNYWSILMKSHSNMDCKILQWLQHVKNLWRAINKKLNTIFHFCSYINFIKIYHCFRWWTPFRISKSFK